MSSISINSITGDSITPDNVDCNVPFITITIIDPSDLLYKKCATKTGIIYGIDNNKLENILSSNNLPLTYAPLADILVHPLHAPHRYKILLVNDTLPISTKPKLYERIMKYGHGYIWKPINITFPTIFTSIGLIYSVKKPTGNYRLIDVNYTANSEVILNNFANDHLILSNEYDMFVTEYDDRKTINKQQLLYGCASVDSKSKSLLKTGKTTEILGLETMANTTSDCIEGTCMETGTGVPIDDAQSIQSIPTWEKKFGKKIVLVSATDPWYVNTDTTIPAQTMKYTEPSSHNSDYSPPHALYNKANLLKTLKTQPSGGVEPFEQTPRSGNNILNLIICLLICIIVLQLFFIIKY